MFSKRTVNDNDTYPSFRIDSSKNSFLELNRQKYKIGKKLGGGDEGIVFHGIDQISSEEVAIKISLPFEQAVLIGDEPITFEEVITKRKRNFSREHGFVHDDLNHNNILLKKFTDNNYVVTLIDFGHSRTIGSNRFSSEDGMGNIARPEVDVVRMKELFANLKKYLSTTRYEEANQIFNQLISSLDTSRVEQIPTLDVIEKNLTSMLLLLDPSLKQQVYNSNFSNNGFFAKNDEKTRLINNTVDDSNSCFCVII
jgi:serine/threonine protein kinase